MANLALTKLPIEKEKWTRSEDATNGIVINYDGTSGFAAANWPCTYTLDLEVEYRLSVIRFLLWDNLGNPNNRINNRKYKFTLSISSDGINFVTVFSNQNQDGSNGWFSFRFINETYARYVRLVGHYNTANEQIHIVEFEIHDQEPPQLASNNVHNIDVITGMGMPSEERISELISKVISQKNIILEGTEEKIKNLDRSLKQSSQALEQIELIKKSNDFTTEAIKNNNRANRWLIASCTVILIFFAILLLFVFCDKHSTTIITDASTNKSVQPYTTLLLSAFYVTKALLLSTLLFILGWFLKNYRSEKHNYVINKHKAMTLTVATGILTKEDYKLTDKGNIFIQAMEIIFTHQTSGFSKEDNSSPSVVNTLLQKRIPKTDV
ncbi:MAG: discoidin domain-containing protein [Chitinophagaceae bacterium]